MKLTVLHTVSLIIKTIVIIIIIIVIIYSFTLSQASLREGVGGGVIYAHAGKLCAR